MTEGNPVAQKYQVAFTLPDSMLRVYSEIFKLDLPTFNFIFILIVFSLVQPLRKKR